MYDGFGIWSRTESKHNFVGKNDGRHRLTKRRAGSRIILISFVRQQVMRIERKCTLAQDRVPRQVLVLLIQFQSVFNLLNAVGEIHGDSRV